MRATARQLFAICTVVLLVSAAGCSGLLHDGPGQPTPTTGSPTPSSPTPTATATSEPGTSPSPGTSTATATPSESKNGETDGTVTDDGRENNAGGGSTGGGSAGSGGGDSQSAAVVDADIDRVSADRMYISGEVPTNGTLAAEDLSTASGNTTGVSLSELDLTVATSGSVSLDLQQSTARPTGSPAVEGDSPNRTATYLTIDHPSLANEDIERVAFEFAVQKAKLDPNASEFTVLRLVDGEWTPVPVEIVEETATTYRLRAVAPGMSNFAAIADAGQTWNVLFDQWTVAESYEPFYNESLNATQYDDLALDRANISAYFMNKALSEMCGACGKVSSGKAPEMLEMFRIMQTNATEEEKIEQAKAVSDEPLNQTTLDGLRGNITPKQYLNQSVGLSDKQKETAIGKLKSTAGDELTKRTRHGGKALFAIKLALIVLFVTGSGYAGTKMADAYAIGYHLENPGYSAASYRDLHANLRALDDNTEDIASARQQDDRAAVRRHLEQRRTLLNETYRLLPRFLDDVHASIIDDAAGHEDLNAYRTIRFVTEALRVRLLEDHRATADLLAVHEGGGAGGAAAALDGSTETPPNERIPMPTHGWTVVYSMDRQLAEEGVLGTLFGGPQLALSYNLDSDVSPQMQTDIFGRSLADDKFGQSTVYDTMDTPTDYAIYQIDLPAGADDQKLAVSIMRPNGTIYSTEAYEARLSSSPPTDPTNPSGQRLISSNLNSDSLIMRQLEVTATAETYYLTVAANGSVGSYNVFAGTNASGAAIEVMGRAGPDIQRPNVGLRDSPPSVDTSAGTVYVERDETVSLTWHAWDVKTATTDLEYRYRVASPGGVTSWSSWQAVPADGDITVSETLAEGYHTVQLVVRDTVGYRTERLLTVKTDTTAPTIDLGVDDADANDRPRLSVVANERLETIRFEYALLNESSGGDHNWTYWQTTDTAGSVTFPDMNASSDILVRAKGFDLANWSSPWDHATVEERTTERIFRNLTQTETTGNVTENQVTVSNSTDSSDPVNTTEEAMVTIESAFNESIQSVELAGEIIDGELILDIYVASRNLERIRLDSIEFTKDEPINITEIVPPEYAGDTRVDLVFRGSGTASISSVTTTTGPANITIDVSPAPVTVGEQVTASAMLPDEMAVNIDEYAWDTDGDGATDGTGSSVGVSYPSSGFHTINLTVTDQLGRTANLSKTVRVNELPTAAIAVGNATPRTYQRVSFTSAGSADPDGTIERHEWNIDADGDVDHVGPTLTTSFATDGSHQVSLTVVDDAGERATTTRTVTVHNQAPMVGIDTPNDVLDNDSLVFTARANDVDGEVAAYEWAVDGGPFTAGNETYTHGGLTGGLHEIVLRVTDDDGATNATTVQFRVGYSPEISVTGPETVLTGETATFDASGSTDRDGTVETIEWNLDSDGRFDDGQGETVSLSRGDDGTVTVRVRVTDDDGLTTVESLTLTIENRDPVAREDSATLAVLANATVTLDGRASTDPDGHITDYAWDLDGDGTVDATGVSPTVRFDTAGSRTLTLTVTDDDGATNTTTRTLSVLSAVNHSLTGRNDTDLAGNDIALEYRFENNESGRLQNVALDLGGLPEEWSLVRIERPEGGSWNASTSTLTDSLSGTTYRDTDELVLRAIVHPPANTSIGNYSVPVTTRVGGVEVGAVSATAVIAEPRVAMDTWGDTDASGNLVRIRYRIENQEASRIENVSLGFEGLPEGWTVESVSTPDRGRWNATTERVEGDLLAHEPGHGSYDDSDEMTMYATVRIAPNATNGTYDLAAVAQVGAETVQRDTAPVAVEVPETSFTVINDTDAPGNIVDVRYTLRNDENTDVENASIDLGALPDGWEIEQAYAYGEGSWNASTTTVRGDLRAHYQSDSMGLRLRLRVPTNASLGTYDLPVTARIAHHVVTQRNATATVKIPETTTTVVSDTDAPGNIVDLRYTLRNDENADVENASIDLGTLPEGWTVEHVYAYGEGSWNASTTTVRGNLRAHYQSDSMGLRLRLRVPTNASLGTYTIPMTARIGTHVVAERNATATVKIPETTTTVVNDTDAPGNIVDLRYTLQNDENANVENASIDLESIPDDWEIEQVYAYGEGTWNATTTTARGDLHAHYQSDSMGLRLRLRVPANESLGTYRIPVTARIGSHVVAERNATATVKIPETTTAVQNDTDAPGNLVELHYTLRNVENANVENASIDLGELPAGWTIERVYSYERGTWNALTTTARGDLRDYYGSDEIHLRLRIRVPTNASLGTYKIPMTARIAHHVVAERNATATVKIPATDTSVVNDTDAPGNVVELRYRLRNLEATTVENASIDLGELPAGWSIKQVYSYERGTWNTTTTTARGSLRKYSSSDEIYLRVRVQVPENATLGTYTVPMTARIAHHVVAQRNATATVKIPETTTAVQNDTDAPGNLVELRYRLRNLEATTVENASIDIGALPASWTIEQVYSYERGTWNAANTIARGDLRKYSSSDEIHLRLRVRIPTNASLGTYSIPMTARIGTHVVAERNATAHVKIPETTMSVDNDSDVAGNVVELEYRLRNQESTTVENASIDLGALPDGWTLENVYLDERGAWDAATTTARGRLYDHHQSDEIRLRVRLDTPSNASRGNYSIPATARIANEVVATPTATAEVAVPETATSAWNDTGRPGEVVAVRYRLRNLDDSTLENTSLDLGTHPDGWTAEGVTSYSQGTWDASTTTLRGKLWQQSGGDSDQLYVQVELRIPSTASAGNYTVPMTARIGATQVGQPTAQVTVDAS